MKKLTAWLCRHIEAFWYALTIVLPIILRTGRRPVIFSKYSGIGDIICTLPAVLKLKQRHQGVTFLYNCHVDYACLPPMAGITKAVTSFPYAGFLRHWYGWLFLAFYEFPCADEKPDDFCRQYVVQEYAEAHGVSVEDAHPRLRIAADIQSRVNSVLRAAAKTACGPAILIYCGPTWPVRAWPAESWKALVSELQDHGYSNIFLIGVDHHLSATSTSRLFEIPGVVSLINRFSLEETAAAIAASNLFVAVDSGMLHFAAALQIPSVGIFGSTSPRLRLPPEDTRHCVVSTAACQGCHHRIPRIHWETGCPHDVKCMKMISVAEVRKACLRLLDRV
jgi:ADP-heptose:LPS heptosyltransferase